MNAAYMWNKCGKVMQEETKVLGRIAVPLLLCLP
jgi:hypothetical protein